jgi:hypothetical protein
MSLHLELRQSGLMSPCNTSVNTIRSEAIFSLMKLIFPLMTVRLGFKMFVF